MLSRLGQNGRGPLKGLLPLQLAGFIGGTVAMLMWLPMLLFEVPLGFWLLIKGVRHAQFQAVPD